ncbi:MAG: RNA 2'-phosphotransferase [Chitinophagaceae bacterium]|nr:MAG: RNA 2'-phosphotransferase [Chitinophagaceae bacterium]
MEEKEIKRFSKFLSLVLRHQPGLIGIHPDARGWVEVKALLDAFAAHGSPLSPDQLDHIVHTNTKKRFAFDTDRTMIRASQGHSIPVDLDLPVRIPPSQLYHGTAVQNIAPIRAGGLQPRERTHVHLSDNPATAREVGARHGKPVVLEIDTAAMVADGFTFFISENNVWLSAMVPARYICFPSQDFL